MTLETKIRIQFRNPNEGICRADLPSRFFYDKVLYLTKIQNVQEVISETLTHKLPQSIIIPESYILLGICYNKLGNEKPVDFPENVPTEFSSLSLNLLYEPRDPQRKWGIMLSSELGNIGAWPELLNFYFDKKNYFIHMTQGEK